MSLQRIPTKKNRPFVLLLLLAAVIIIMVLMSKCSHRETPSQGIHPVAAKSGGDTLDVAIEISPLSYRWQGDTIAGLDYEIMKGVASIARRPVKFHPFAPLKEAVNGMERGIYDIIISSLPSTESLKQRFRLTDDIYLDREVLVQRKDASPLIEAPEQLGNDSVWIAAGSPFAQRIKNLSSEIGEPIHIVSAEGRTAEHLVMLVARGEIPRAVVNAGLAKRMKAERYPHLDISIPVSFTQFQCWVVSGSDGALADSLNRWIARFKTTSEYRDILNRYQ